MLKDQKLMSSKIEKRIRILKTFLNWSLEKGYTKNVEFKKIKTRSISEKQILFLTWDEVIKLLEKFN